LADKALKLPSETKNPTVKPEEIIITREIKKRITPKEIILFRRNQLLLLKS